MHKSNINFFNPDNYVTGYRTSRKMATTNLNKNDYTKVVHTVSNADHLGGKGRRSQRNEVCPYGTETNATSQWARNTQMTARKNESSFERDNITDASKVHKIKTYRGNDSKISVIGSIQGKEVHPQNRKFAASSLSQL